MRPTLPNRLVNQGFSIIEIMVGLAIGLISMLIVMQVFATFEGQKRTTTSGANAQTSGGLGLYTMERDIRMAGYGFSASVGCTLQTAQAMPAPFSDALLKAVRIDAGVGSLPDTLTLFTSDKSSWSVPIGYLPIPPAAPPIFAPGVSLGLVSPAGVAAGDMMIAYQGSTCTLFQVDSVDTTDPLNPFLNHSAGSWNGAIAGAPTYTSQAQLMDLGNFVGHSYALDVTGNLVATGYCATNANSYSACPATVNSASSQILASDIVNMKAQYGFDTNPDPRTTVNVNNWSSAMIDADGSGTAGDIGDIRRIYAVRLAIVARSGLKEKPQSDGTCNTTTVGTMAWAGGTLDITINPDGSANPDWQCYRYKTFETVIPLRNLIW
ncbi:MAG: PilW family protein [Gallionellaceae bacterium]